MASFIVVYDANVLYPNALRDLLVRIAQLPHLVQASCSAMGWSRLPPRCE